MIKLTLIVFLALTFYSCGTLGAADHCQVWKNLAQTLTQAHMATGGTIHFDCSNDGSSCTQLQCSGRLNIPAFTQIPVQKVDFCFGIRLQECTSPPSIRYYVDVPAQNLSMNGTITHNETFTIPGLQYKMDGIEGDLVTVVQMEQVNSSIKFGVLARVRVELGNGPLFLRDFQVFPVQYIPIDTCPTGAPSPSGAFVLSGNCTPPASAVVMTTTFAPVLQKECEMGLMGIDCGINMQCVGKSSRSRNGICACNPEAIMNKSTGQCEVPGQTTSKPTPVNTTPSGGETTKQPIVKTTKAGQQTTKQTSSVSPDNKQTSAPQKSRDTGKKIGSTALIIGGVAGGILLIVVIVTGIICIGRRRRNAIYRDRQQLLTNDDEDDDVNMLI